MSGGRPAIAFLQAMPFPTDQTHSIQIARTVAALADHADVTLIVGRLTVDPATLAEAVTREYGVSFGPGIRVVVAPGRLHGLWFRFTVGRLLAELPPNAIWYTRTLAIARRLLRTRRLHRRPIYLETHLAGYHREDPVPGSRYRAIRERFERDNEAGPTIERVFAGVDGVFFLHRHALEIVRAKQRLVSAQHLWYGWRSPSLGEQPRQGLVFCGSIAEHKLFGLLLDALDRVHGSIGVTVYGGEPDLIEANRRRLEGRPAAARIRFEARVPPASLGPVLARFRNGIALQEGLKVIDYLEHGVMPIVPDLPSYRNEFDDRHVVFYAPDDPDSLARAMEQADRHQLDWSAIEALAARYSTARRAERIIATIRAQ